MGGRYDQPHLVFQNPILPDLPFGRQCADETQFQCPLRYRLDNFLGAFYGQGYHDIGMLSVKLADNLRQDMTAGNRAAANAQVAFYPPLKLSQR